MVSGGERRQHHTVMGDEDEVFSTEKAEEVAGFGAGPCGEQTDDGSALA